MFDSTCRKQISEILYFEFYHEISQINPKIVHMLSEMIAGSICYSINSLSISIESVNIKCISKQTIEAIVNQTKLENIESEITTRSVERYRQFALPGL
jgi:hypothetical protein